MAQMDPERLFDLRTVGRQIRAGLITEEAYQEHLASLPDVSDKIRPRDEGGDDDGYDRPRAAHTAAPQGPAHPAEAALPPSPTAEAPGLPAAPAHAPLPPPAVPATAPATDDFAASWGLDADAPVAPVPSAPAGEPGDDHG